MGTSVKPREPRAYVQGLLKVGDVVQGPRTSRNAKASRTNFNRALDWAPVVTQLIDVRAKNGPFGLFTGSSKGMTTSDDRVREPVPHLLRATTDLGDDGHWELSTEDPDTISR